MQQSAKKIPDMPVWQWQPGQAGQANLPELQELFQQAFTSTMSPQQWRWKYSATKEWGSAVRHNNRLVAFYGGMPRQLLLFGYKVAGVQIGDVMVAPDYRRILTRRGPFFLAASQFAEQFVGPGKRYHCAFGFPSERHNRLGEHLGLYGRIGDLLEAEWEPLPNHSSMLTKVVPLRQKDLPRLAPLWRKMAADLSGLVVPCRDPEYLQYRFMQHPVANYQLQLVQQRLTGRIAGLLVLRSHGKEGLELLDLVGGVARMPSMVEAARVLAGQQGCKRLFCWLTQPVADRLKKSSPKLTDLNIPLPTIIWKQSKELLASRGQWWLTGGDTDFR